MAQGRFDHAPRSERNGAGENLASATGMSETVIDEAVRATRSWYDELKNPGYNFNNPGYNENPGAGHFTQVKIQSAQPVVKIIPGCLER